MMPVNNIPVLINDADRLEGFAKVEDAVAWLDGEEFKFAWSRNCTTPLPSPKSLYAFLFQLCWLLKL